MSIKQSVDLYHGLRNHLFIHLTKSIFFLRCRRDSGHMDHAKSQQAREFLRSYVNGNRKLITDWLDGWLARKFGQVSEFGKFMDALSDKVLTLGMFVSLLALGELGKWALFPILLILSRELLITGLRLVAAGRGKTLAAEKIGKLKTVIQLTCICLILGKISAKVDLAEFANESWHQNLVLVLDNSGSITLLFATALTVYSGIVYLVKYWRFFIEENDQNA